MNNRSNHLDNLITKWKKEAEAEFNQNQEILINEIKGFEKKWEWKKFADNIYLPITAFVFLVILLTGERVTLYFGIVPFSIIAFLIYTQRRSNLEIDRIDITMDVASFSSKQSTILERELELLNFAKFVFMPLMAICILGEFFYYIFISHSWFLGIVAALKFIAVIYLIKYVRRSIKKASDNIEAMKF